MEALVTTINKLPAEYWMIMLPILIAFAVFYVLPRIRRDKQGKLYFHSTIRGQTDVKQKLDSISSRLTSVEMENLKQSVFIPELPIQERLYAGLKYIAAGGNSTVLIEVQRLVKENSVIYDAIVLIHPGLALKVVKGA